MINPSELNLSTDVHACSKQTPYYRLNAQTLRQDYELGLITATGYLYYIVKVSRKDGWLFAIDDVTTFCKEWGLKRATFYDAKAKCVTLGLLKETIKGRVILQAETPIVPINVPVSDFRHLSESWTGIRDPGQRPT